MGKQLRKQDNKRYGYILRTPIGDFQSVLYSTYEEGLKVFARSLSNCLEQLDQSVISCKTFHDLKGRTYLECLNDGEYILPGMTCQFIMVPSHRKE